MAEENNQQEESQLQFSLQRIYVKDISFESPNSPKVFQQAFKPQVGLDIDSTAEQVAEGLYEIVVKVTAQVTNTEDGATAFLAEVEQAGLFLIQGLEGDQLAHTLGAFCPNVLFPYARECIDNLVNRGSFPPLMLAPVNFDAMYAQKQQQAAQANNTVQ